MPKNNGIMTATFIEISKLESIFRIWKIYIYMYLISSTNQIDVYKLLGIFHNTKEIQIPAQERMDMISDGNFEETSTTSWSWINISGYPKIMEVLDCLRTSRNKTNLTSYLWRAWKQLTGGHQTRNIEALRYTFMSRDYWKCSLAVN